MSRRSIAIAACLASAVLAAPVHASHWSRNTEDNNPVCTATGFQDFTRAVSDGAGGIIVTWQDLRVDLYHQIYAQRISANGDPMWTADGVLLGAFPSNQQAPEIVTDGAGGAIVIWIDQRVDGGDLYAQRISAAGTVLWNPNGVPISVATNVQTVPKGLADGAGGAIFVWTDLRPGTATDIYAQRINGSGAVQWAANGVAVCAATQSQGSPSLATDRAQGAVIAWEDLRSDASGDIYAQRVRSDGTMAWTLNGVAVAVQPFQQRAPSVAYAQGTGAYVTWHDSRNAGTDFQIYIQRLFSNGSPAYAVNGTLLSMIGGTGDNFRPQIVDGASMFNPVGSTVYVLWEHVTSLNEKELVLKEWYFTGIFSADWELEFGNGDKLNPKIVPHEGDEGGVLIAYTSDGFYGSGASNVFLTKFYAATFQFGNGVPVCIADGSQGPVQLVSDFQGGGVMAWDDRRQGTGHSDIRAQRIESTGSTGYGSPDITSIVDAPQDQGRQVIVSWTRSFWDATDVDIEKVYSVWRRDPAALSTSVVSPRARAQRAEERRAAAITAGISSRVADQLTATGWEIAGTSPAVELSSYALTTETYRDSTSPGTPKTEFMVIFSTNAGDWYSRTGSGHSVDNLAPSAPLNLAGATSGLDAQLSWQHPNASPDVVAYNVYRATTPGVPLTVSHRIATVPDLTHLDATTFGTTHYYVVTAVDDAAQEGPRSNEVAAPVGVTDVASAPPVSLSLSALGGNPVRHGVSFRYGLPAEGEVTLAVYDLSGRQVHHARATRTAGWHEHRLDVDAAQLRSGAYFVRLNTGRESRTLKFAVLR